MAYSISCIFTSTENLKVYYYKDESNLYYLSTNTNSSLMTKDNLIDFASRCLLITRDDLVLRFNNEDLEVSPSEVAVLSKQILKGFNLREEVLSLIIEARLGLNEIR
jgi:hypothetical protein